MSKSTATTTPLILVFFSAIFTASSGDSPPAMCPVQPNFLISTLNSQCPFHFSPNSPLQVGSDFLDRILNSKGNNAYISVLFYASWCPFSHNVRLTFRTLSAMFPHIEHLEVEESSVVPRVHSFPTILMVKQTSKFRYLGAKDLKTLVRFYRKTTGWEPIQYVDMEQPISSEVSGEFVMRSWVGSSPSEILKREPYLVLSLLFLCLAVLINALPKVLLHFKPLWVAYGPHLNLGIFGETSQILGRLLQMINIKMIWTKLKLCKTSSFYQCAKKLKNARVWASSLPSVSLGKTSSSKSES
ncbi:5'-adenylylsulfate reductase-like 7 isoform X2 [Apium graveolens]|uniref:5'-adenylylsulfate reductase-like 7 isoform X2 n=1 Tax=Apium graveolens TaxID=4045 RepID=UPI003D79BB22